jgi:hypothetical protein
MKTMLTSLALLFSLNAMSQTITNLYIIPSNPGATDTVKIIADLMFNSGGCDIITQSVNTNGNTTTIAAYHCIGPLTYICNTSDTFTLGLLPPSLHTVNFELFVAGFVTPDCSTFSHSGSDTLMFNVDIGNTLPNLSPVYSQLHYNGQNQNLIIQNIENPDSRIAIYNAAGQLCFSGIIQDVIDCTFLKNGIYFIKLSDQRNIRYDKFLKR